MVHLKLILCGSRKYTYLPHRWFFTLNPLPLPLQKFQVSFTLFFFNFSLSDPRPSPPEFLVTIHGEGLDIFWKHTLLILSKIYSGVADHTAASRRMKMMDQNADQE